MTTKSLGFIGGGRICKIFLQAFQNKSIKFDSIVVYDPQKSMLNAIKKQFPEIEIVQSINPPAVQDIVILAVHPPVMMEVLLAIKESVSEETFILSLAPKISIEKMASMLPTDKIIRMIPNATSIINEGFNPVCFHLSFADDEKQKLVDTFKVLGKTFEVEENKLESYAIISAMLPTYFWFQWEELKELGIQMGLNVTESETAIKETLQGASQLFYNSEFSTEEVIDLIPVKPIGKHQEQIRNIYRNNLIPLFQKIKPTL